jgi:hypothetical protein
LSINKLTKSLDGNYISPTDAEINIEVNDPQRVAEYRVRLAHISHFIGSLCEYLSRRINQDDCKSGTLWEGRFDCRSIEDEAGLLTTGIYVDLNQIRAGEAETPEQSTYTSVATRIDRMMQQLQGHCDGKLDWERLDTDEPADSWLAPLTLDSGIDSDVRLGLRSASGERASDRGMLPLPLKDYLELLEATGRQLAEGKSGAIPSHLEPVLQRLGVVPDRWLETIRDFEKLFGKSIGHPDKLVQRASRNGCAWIRGVSNCSAAFL